MTIAGLLKEYKEAYSSRVGFIYSEFGEITEISVEQFCKHVNKAAAYWNKTMGGSGNRIGLVGENSYSYLVHLFGIMCSGNAAVPFNQTYENDMIYTYIQRANLSAVICAQEYKDCIEGTDLWEKYYSMESTFQEATDNDDIEKTEIICNPEDVILLLHSSGTSGMSKLVQITNKNLSTFPTHVLSKVKGKIEEPDTCLTILPFYHIGGVIPLLEDMMRGNRIILGNAKYMLRDIEQQEVNKLVLVPAMMKKILAQCEKKPAFKEKCSTIREALCLGTALDPDLITQMYAASISPKVYYGMTETTGTVSGWGEYKTGACGKVEPFSNVKIEDGEILVQGDNVMSGYYKNEQETEKVLVNGWLHTGDLGYIDEEGYLYVKGRKKNIIILSNGENVSPEELENRLYESPYVTECRVYGEDDMIKAEIYSEQQGEEVHARIQDFVRELNRELPPAQKIKKVNISEQELKKNSMGKLMR